MERTKGCSVEGTRGFATVQEKMLAAIKKAKTGPPLHVIMQPLNAAQKQYLLVRLCGGDPKEAYQSAWKQCRREMTWVHTPEWVELETNVLSYPEQYQKEALMAYAEAAGMMAVKILYDVLKMATLEGWSRLDPEDKKHVMSAVGIFARVMPKPESGKVPAKGYEAMLLDMHKEDDHAIKEGDE